MRQRTYLRHPTACVTAIARKITAALDRRFKPAGTGWQYGGSAAGATFGAALASAGPKAPSAIAGRVLPTLAHHSLALAYGFVVGASGAASAGKLLADVEGSLRSNDAAALVASRRFLRYAAANVGLDYPEGWLANLTNPKGSWFIGPTDQAVMIAAGLQIGDAPVDAAGLKTLGHQVIQGYVQAQVHPNIGLLRETASAGLYRWIAAWTGAGDATVGVEEGEVIVHGGRAMIVFGDTELNGAPTNLLIFGRALDSAARAAGVTPTASATVADVVVALKPYTTAASSNGSSAASGVAHAGAASSSGAYLSPYQSYLSEHAAYQSALASSYEMYTANLNVISNMGDSGTYYRTRSQQAQVAHNKDGATEPHHEAHNPCQNHPEAGYATPRCDEYDHAWNAEDKGPEDDGPDDVDSHPTPLRTSL